MFWKQQKWLAPHTPPDVQLRGAVQGSGGVRGVAGDAFRDGLQHQPRAGKGRRRAISTLDPNGRGKLVKSHPATAAPVSPAPMPSPRRLAGTISKLSKQGVQQLQSTTATPKRSPAANGR
jgi:hypothetical protein